MNGQASLTTTYTVAGTHSIRASFAATAQYLASISATIFQVVRNLPASTTTVLTSSGTTEVGQPVTFTTTVSSTLGPIPDGETVTFADGGGAALGSATLIGGVAKLTISTLTAGNHPIRATYVGDATFAASTSPALTQIVTKYATTTTQTDNPNPSTYGQALALTATVTSGGPNAPSGTVVFRDGTTRIGSVALVAGGVAILTIATLPAGAHALTATYGGDAASAASTGAASQTVNQSPTTTTIVSSRNPSNFGRTITFTAKVTSPTTHPRGTVTFTAGANVLGTVNLSSVGIARISTAMLPRGQTDINATYVPTANFVGSSVTLTQTVN
jgi:hypothetical protein